MCDRAYLIDNRSYQHASLAVLRNLSVARATERRYRIERAVRDELRPQFAANVVRYPARHSGPLEHPGDEVRAGAWRTQNEVATADMFDRARFGCRCRDVHHGCKGREAGCLANAIGVVDAVLQTQHHGAGRNELRELASDGRRIAALHAEQDELGAVYGTKLG